MKVPVKITLGVVLAVAALGAAYFMGAYMSRPDDPQEISRLIPYDELDFATSMVDVDYDRLVASIVAMRAHDGDLIQYEGSVDTLHRAVLDYIARRLDFTSEERALLADEYAASSNTTLIDYRQMMGSMNVDSMAPTIQPIVSYESYNSVNEFVGIFSGHACGLLSFPGLSQLKQAGGLVDGKDIKGALDVRLTCQNVLREAIAPIARALRAKAVIRDLNTSQLNIETQVRSMVVELATAQDHLSGDLTDFYQTKFLFMKSEAILRARVDATVKVGFDLNKRFSIEMDHDRRSMTIRLPEPEVLSNEVEVEFIDAKNGALVKIDREKYNAAMEHAREMMDEQVAGSSIFVAAKKNARRIIRTVFQPMMSLPEFRYEVEVLFPHGYAAPVRVLEAAG